MKRIALILPYFTMSGKGMFPSYFQFFLQSCAENPTIDWLVYTDDAFDYQTSPNIHIKKCTFRDFKARIQQIFSFRICLERPYKLCDFKPAYGEALANDLKGYDFWGHCDCDLIFGDIRSFLTDEVLSKYNKILTRGHLTLYRNTPEVNAYYRHADIERVFTTSASCAFDEWGQGGASSLWADNGQAYYDGMVADDIIAHWDGFHLTKAYIGAYHEQNDKSLLKKYGRMKYIYYEHKDGKLNRKSLVRGELNTESVLYAHFQKREITPPISLATVA